ncbi:MAG: hypothetical protein CVU89_00670 [Firmicutes bacterium HGW-Firmicutes-14]|nr:MAG: hypothetical protein CVU89_00670 [Firmicutes bacterium HGW-Firmicutes-14]
MKKRLISLLVLAVFLFSVVSPAAALDIPSPQISREEAMKIARSQMEIPEDMKLTGINYRYEETGNQVWSFNWNSGKPEKPGDISVEIDAMTGKIRSFWRWSSENYEGQTKYSLEDARKIAEEYVQNINPDEYGHLRLEPPVDPNVWITAEEEAVREKALLLKGGAAILPPRPAVEYYFRFTRVVNGYPYWDNGINVNVSSTTGQIVSYYYNWDNEEIPTVGEVVYLKQAKEIFGEKIGLDLGYISVWNEASVRPEQNVALGYLPKNYAPMYIDATTGEVIDYMGKTATIPQISNEPISNTAASELPEVSLTMEEAAALAGKWVDIPEGYRFANAYYNEDPSGVYPSIWNFSWNNMTQNGMYGYLNVGINASTGEVTNIDTGYDPGSMPQANITEAEARKIAIDFLKEVAPAKVNQLRKETGNPYYEYPYQSTRQKSQYYYFNFSRLVNGIPFPDNGAYVTVSGEGKVTTFNINWGKADFPSTEDLITPERAVDIFTNQNGFEVGYTRLRDGNEWQTRLVYRINYSDFYIDAKTGEVKSRWGGPLYSKAAYRDIAGHWAEGDIAKLAEMNITDNTRQLFKPDDPISRGEVTAMLIKALELNQYLPNVPSFSDVPMMHQYYGYIEAAYKAGIINGYDGKFNPDEGVTREELAVILVNGLNGSEAEGDATLDRFNDAGKISDWAQDAVISSVNMGLIMGDDKGNFNPRQNVTRAEAAAIIARIIERDSPK